MNIEISKPTENDIQIIKNWPIWTCDVSSFPWYYEDKETCLILEGEVEVQSDAGLVSFMAGDLVVFPKGLSCTWNVKKAVKKHYKFG